MVHALLFHHLYLTKTNVSSLSFTAMALSPIVQDLSDYSVSLQNDIRLDIWINNIASMLIKTTHNPPNGICALHTQNAQYKSTNHLILNCQKVVRVSCRPPELDFVPGIQLSKPKCACQNAGYLSFWKIWGTIKKVIVPAGCCKARKLTDRILIVLLLCLLTDIKRKNWRA